MKQRAVWGFPAHPEREALLAEAHARPFQTFDGATRFFHFAFARGQVDGRADIDRLSEFCKRHNVAPPAADARHFSGRFHDANLRWESHAEFTTYTWSVAIREGHDSSRITLMTEIANPGVHLVSIDLEVNPSVGLENKFDQSSLAVASVHEGAAIVATDFRADVDGFVRIAVRDVSLSPAQRGALAQRLLELETYRMLALMGLLEAQRLGPSVSAIERDLARVTAEMTNVASPGEDEALLNRLTSLAARLEAGATASLYRFGASRAYAEIVQGRLSAIGEKHVPGHENWSQFLGRRLQPAMRTCTTLEERQANLSRKLARAAQLLRTRVDIELARQNRDLLQAMDRRTALQLRLQQTIEGLSIAAISYYLVGLLKYVVDAVTFLHAREALTLALATPVVVLGVALFLRHVRKTLEGV